MSEKYDVVIVGGGPGGYVAAIRCAQMGFKTACIDNRQNDEQKAQLGGTCLNVGCIPSKALLDSSEQFHKLNHTFAAHGISADNVNIDVPKMIKRKEKIVKQLTGGIAQLFKANKVDSYLGFGQLQADKSVDVFDQDSNKTHTLTADNVILAPGSVPIELPSMPFDGDLIVDSTGALEFDKAPERLGIIGAGVIGLELGSVWRRLGSEVVVLEAMDKFLSAADSHVAREAAKQFKSQGLDIRLSAMAKSVSTEGGKVTLEYEQKGEKYSETFDKLIVAVGRKPATANVLADDTGVKLDERGFIVVDDECKTDVKGVWAIGDAVRGPMLAHKSSEEGVAVADRIGGGYGHVDFNTVPWVIYTAPEIAWVGKTEDELKEQGIAYKTGNFPFAATGRAQAMEEPIGFIKMLADEKTDKLLGIHMIGPHVSELIAECVLAMEYQASSEDLARTIHAHPTLSEAIHEAALAVDKRAIHKFG